MTKAEWESLCDGCGRCCLNKLEEEGTGKTFYTDVGCRLLDGEACRCRDYPHRLAKVNDCVRLTPKSLARISWLPPSCAYVLVGEGKDLYWWHPLVSGDPDTRPLGRRLGARPRRRQREGRARRGTRGAHRQLAPEAAEGRAAEEKAVARERLSSRPARQRGEGTARRAVGGATAA